MTDLTVFRPFAKTDPVRRELHVDLYKGGVLDSAGEFMTPETVRKMVHGSDPKALRIDREHDQKPIHPTHAQFVEWAYDEDTAAAKAVIKFSPEAWTQVVEPGTYKGVSIFGSGLRKSNSSYVAKAGSKITGTEIVDPKLTLVSLVTRPANRTQSPEFVAKTDPATPEWVRMLMDTQSKLASSLAELDKRLDATKALLDKGGKRRGVARDEPADIAKAVEAEHTTRTAIEVRGLERRLEVLHTQLHDLWERPSGRNPAAREATLLGEIEKAETELAALRGTAEVFGIGDAARSAFHQRGGVSTRVDAGRAPFGGDSYFAPKGDARLRKSREDAVDLSSLRI
jgi:hypothetical protein